MSDPSVDLSKSPDRPAILGQFSVVNQCLPADNKVIPNALMSINQRQTEKKLLSFDGWTMIDGWSTDYSTTASTEEIDHRRRK